MLKGAFYPEEAPFVILHVVHGHPPEIKIHGSNMIQKELIPKRRAPRFDYQLKNHLTITGKTFEMLTWIFVVRAPIQTV